MKKQEKIFLISVFIIFLIIFILSPISGDDWGNYLVGKKGLRHMIGQAIGMYYSWEGRFISRIFINLLTYHKWLWNIVNSFLITIIIYYIVKIINPKNKKQIYLLSLLSILGMNIYMFSQSITWLAGNITYLFPLTLIIIYIYILKNNLNSKNYILLSILNFILPMFVEHMAVLLVVINIFVLIYKYIINKKIDKKFLIYLILSTISTLIMFLSPGTKLRNGMENIEFNKLSIIGKIIYNIPNFIYYTFIVNNYLLLLFVIVIIHLINKTVKNKYKYFLYLYISVVPILTIISYILNIFKLATIDSNNILLVIYYITFILIYFVLIIKNIKEYKYILIFSILALFPNIIMLLSPTWGYRTALATYIMFMIPLLKIIDEIKINKSFLIIINAIFIIVYISMYTNIYIKNKNREESIIKSLNNKEKTIYIELLPNYGPCNINPTNEYHLKVFKKYYNIDDDIKVIIK